jgi:CRP-like cAMP-binding protein
VAVDNGGARHPLVAKLSQFAPLSDEDMAALEAMCEREEHFPAGTNIVVEAQIPRSAFVVTRGMACRYRLMPDGKRQILTILIPGDVFDLHGFLLKAMDHSVVTISPTRVAAIGRGAVIEVILDRPRVGAALWWSAMQEEAMLRERIVALGRRSARGRVAYLLCELVWRQRAIGIAEDHAVRLPFTQTDLADMLGLTSVHINRILQGFRRDELITLDRRRLALLDIERLQAISGLTSEYLKLKSTPPEVLRYFDGLELELARLGPPESAFEVPTARAMMDGRQNPLVAKLSQFAPLSPKDIALLEGLCLSEERLRAGASIEIEGRAPHSAFVVTRGMACRYRLTPDGRRQILTILIPGDFCNLHGFLVHATDHSVVTIGPTRIAAIGREAVTDIIANHPRVGAALWWSTLQEQAILRERIVALGRRSARGRVAYLLCELVWRQRAIGAAEDHAVRLPFTQTDLADMLGLTSVHTNRVLQGFRRDELITLDRRRLTLLDIERLQAISGLTPEYLKLNSTPPEILRYFDDLERERGVI